MALSDSGDTQRKIVAAIRRIIRAVDQHSRRLADVYGLTGPQLLVLQELVTSGALPTGELARRIHLAQGTTSEILDRLQEQGHVTRARSATDRRKVECSATVQGAALLAKKPSLLHEGFLGELDRLAEWERAMLLSSLQRLADMMQLQKKLDGLDGVAAFSSSDVPGTSESPLTLLGREES